MEKLLSVKESFYSLHTSVHVVKFQYTQKLTLLTHRTFGLLTLGASVCVTKQNNNNNNKRLFGFVQGLSHLLCIYL